MKMCLSTVYYGKKRAAILSELPERVYGWKLVGAHTWGLFTGFRGADVRPGCVDVFKPCLIEYGEHGKTYAGGSHVWLEKPPRVTFRRSRYWLRVSFAKKDIRTIGEQWDARAVTVGRLRWGRKLHRTTV